MENKYFEVLKENLTHAQFGSGEIELMKVYALTVIAEELHEMNKNLKDIKADYEFYEGVKM